MNRDSPGREVTDFIFSSASVDDAQLVKLQLRKEDYSFMTELDIRHAIRFTATALLTRTENLLRN
jgi:hypothetical protein